MHQCAPALSLVRPALEHFEPHVHQEIGEIGGLPRANPLAPAPPRLGSSFMHLGGKRRWMILAAAALVALALVAGAALASTGALTYRDCIANGGANGCAAPGHDSLDGAFGVAVSADGK